METVADSRRQRGLALAKSAGKKIKPVAGSTWLVPSATGAGGYVVDVDAETCSCVDHEIRGGRCKHLWASLYIRRVVEMPDGTSVVTETRVTYAQPCWSTYHKAQCSEIEHGRLLLRELCAGVAQPAQTMGRPRLPLADVIFGASVRAVSTLSARRSQSDLRACAKDGLVEKVASYNSVLRYLAQPSLTPILKSLVTESAKPLAAIESAATIAVDATGFSSTCHSDGWLDEKHGEQKRRKTWTKLHAAVGVVTNVIVAAEVTHSDRNDYPEMPGLLATAASAFDTRTCVADKAYLGRSNLEVADSLGMELLVPMKVNSVPGASPAWDRLYNFCTIRRDEFLRRYHTRSNVESTFSALKRKFGPALRSRTPVAAANELLVRVIAFNVSMLVHELTAVGITPAFWGGAL